MSKLNSRTEWIDTAKIWDAEPHDDWNVDVMTAKSFLDITATGLERQFEDAIMKPYNEMLGGTFTYVLWLKSLVEYRLCIISKLSKWPCC